ncbi:flavodoxin FldA [[Limnothrix rosea] IAM M-220]|uniref:flavodoxin FldA n=1 Tax=[Limnothrix rosea] IAM M-220 TaxID=454133 RepID=UPI000959C98A|nr:flavodoxin FldA [[Limnothrix rosea] IAM M-220]OKH18806.1 flavodoxin [[Limnothrix rosea] IAM M-220]
MAKIGLFFGTQTGNTEEIAEAIQAALGGADVVDVFDVADIETDIFDSYEYLIIGCPTWDIGELQSDWDGLYEDLDNVDFSGKTVAYFGAGDQIGYSDNFQDAMGLLEAKISSLGGKTVGHWSTEGYEHAASKADRGGQFVGLALDEDNQSEMTADRISTWVTQIKPAFGL